MSRPRGSDGSTTVPASNSAWRRWTRALALGSAIGIAAPFCWTGCVSLYLGQPFEVTDDDSSPAGDDDTSVVLETPADGDGDGWPLGEDCNDNDALTYPGAEEICDDQVDNDCDGVTDEDCGDEDCSDGDLIASLSVTDARGNETLVFQEGQDPIFVSQLLNSCSYTTTLLSDTTCFGRILVRNKMGAEMDAFPYTCEAIETGWALDPGESLYYRWVWNRTDSTGRSVPENESYTVVASWLTGEEIEVSIWLSGESPDTDKESGGTVGR